MKLTAVAIRAAKPRNKAYKLFDGGGLYLEVSPAGGKWWRFKYRFAGKEKRLSFGVYPEVSLKQAREKRDETRKQLAAEVDPGEIRKAVKIAKAPLFRPQAESVDDLNRNRCSTSLEPAAEENARLFEDGVSPYQLGRRETGTGRKGILDGVRYTQVYLVILDSKYNRIRSVQTSVLLHDSSMIAAR